MPCLYPLDCTPLFVHHIHAIYISPPFPNFPYMGYIGPTDLISGTATGSILEPDRFDNHLTSPSSLVFTTSAGYSTCCIIPGCIIHILYCIIRLIPRGLKNQWIIGIKPSDYAAMSLRCCQNAFCLPFASLKRAIIIDSVCLPRPVFLLFY